MNLKKCSPCIFLLTILYILSTNYAVASKQITLATSELEPYIGENLPSKGYVHELVTEAFSRVGYNVSIKFYPLARAKHLAELGVVDGLIPSYKEEHLTKNFIFSTPFPGNNIGLLKKKELKAKFFSDPRENIDLAFESLKGYRFGLIRGETTLPYFDQSKFLSKVIVSKHIQSIDQLARDRIDFSVIDKFTAADLITTQRPHLIGKFEFMDLPLATKMFHVAFSKQSKGYKKHKADFDQGLQTLKKDGIFHKILAKHGLSKPQETNSDKVILTFEPTILMNP